MYTVLKNIIFFTLLSFTVHSQNIIPKGQYIYDSEIETFYLDVTENSYIFTITQGRHIPLEVKCKVKIIDTLLYFYYLETLNGYYENKDFNKNKLIFTAIKNNNDLKIVNFHITEFAYYFRDKKYLNTLKKQ